MNPIAAIIILLILCLAPPAWAQESARPARAVEMTLSGGYGYFVESLGSVPDKQRAGAALSVGLTWRPEHRLQIGLESGLTFFYSYRLKDIETSYGQTDAQLHVSAVPLLVVFSMRVLPSVELQAGTGGYLVQSHATSFSSTADVTTFSQGWMAAASWEIFSREDWGIGTRFLWYGATEFGDAVAAAQLSVRLDILHY